MRYVDMQKAIFLERPNRFIALVAVDGQIVRAHVKNTGRCRELLVPGASVYVQHSSSPERKTAWSLIGVEKGSRLINMDSQAPNTVWAEFLDTLPDLPGIGRIQKYRREVRYGMSRMDFWFASEEGEGYMEVKGCTLEEDGIARFPDAPTERGTRHLHELTTAAQNGLLAAAVFIIQMENIRHFEPNSRTDPAFADALKRASEAGVQLYAYTCRVEPAALDIGDTVPIRL